MTHDSIHIWRPATGITDFERDPKTLAASEIPGIRAVWEDRRKRLRGTDQLAAFSEKMAREWAIETGVIEDVYDIDRGVTATLIESGFQSELLTHGSTDKPREFVLQILRDQKDALEGVFDFVKSRRKLSVSYIKELHAALLRSQKATEAVDAFGNSVEIPLLKGEWKEQPNYPVRDGKTYLYCPPEQVASEMDRLIAWHDEHLISDVSPEVEAAWLHHRFSQIHPFQDGNGRVARALASLVLIKGGLFPLVVTRDDRASYIRALEQADEGDLDRLVGLIAQLQRLRFTKAIAISETVFIDDTDAALGELQRAAAKAAAERREAWKRVFDHARQLEEDLVARLEQIKPTIKKALFDFSGDKNVSANVARSTTETDFFYRAQIIENAKKNLGYFANTTEYRSWVALNMFWRRRARLVFAIHGFGAPFSGALICAPFLQFTDTDDTGERSPPLVPVSDEGFLLFYSETGEQALSRFQPWRERVLTVGLKELSRNL